MKRTLFIIYFIALVFLLVSRAEAAVLFMTPKSGELKIGQTFDLEIKVNTEGAGFNAAQATVQFPVDVLEVESVDSSPTASIFNFWLEGPSFSNKDGKIIFIGGTTNGVSGNSIPILKIKFLVKGSGAADIVFSDTAVTASDGSGTNILSVMEIARLTVSPTVVAPTESAALELILPPPTPVIRTPVKAKILPEKPKIAVPLYPDEERWYNLAIDFIAKWELPEDISGVNAAVDRNFSYINRQSEGLFESKVFPAITEDGAWYLHARFKNNVGWGPTANYRIGIDRRPPQPFEIKAVEGLSTDNPSPTLKFQTNDGLSGLENYLVRIDGEKPIILSPGVSEFKLPLQPPGKHIILIRAMDKAENSIEDSIDLEILPIASPAITFVTKELFSDEETVLTVKGTVSPNIKVLLEIKQLLRNNKGETVAKSVAEADDKGNWEATFSSPLRNGRYAAMATSQDSRGALSLPVESSEIQVKNKPIIQIGPLQLGKGGSALLLLVILVLSFSAGIWFYKKRQEKLELRVLMAESEVGKIFRLIADGVGKLIKAHETLTSADDEYELKKLQELIQKMESYLKKGIQKIKK